MHFNIWLNGDSKLSEFSVQGDQRGGTHTNEKSHVKFITIGCNGPYERKKRSDLNPLRSI